MYISIFIIQSRKDCDYSVYKIAKKQCFNKTAEKKQKKITTKFNHFNVFDCIF